MHTLTVTLKQHTPLIHFQHDQEGATLRASEVKPKLDKFILTKLGKGNYEVGIEQARNNGWLVGKGDHPALDYKMRITADGQCFKKQLKIINAAREAVIYENNLIHISTGEDIIDLLIHYIPAFFIVHNFGYRQSKGYGSYTISRLLKDGVPQDVQLDIDATLKDFFWSSYAVLTDYNEYEIFYYFSFDLKKYCSIPKDVRLKRIGKLQFDEPFNGVFENVEHQMGNLKKEIEKLINKSEIPEIKRKEYRGILLSNDRLIQLENDVKYNFYEVLFSKFVDQDYQQYKQGTREDRRNDVAYDKAGIWHYFNDLEQTGNVVYWEKRAIKQRIDSLSINQLFGYSLKNDHVGQSYNELHTQDDTEQQYHYIRAILGLAENFEFQTNDRYVKFVVTVSNCDDNQIERMQSSIFYKIIDNDIYVCLQRPEKVSGINNVQFKLTLNIIRDHNRQKTKLNNHPIDLGQITTPTFDVDSLYENILEFYENNDYVIK